MYFGCYMCDSPGKGSEGYTVHDIQWGDGNCMTCTGTGKCPLCNGSGKNPYM
jgi:hypothetical protein